MYRRKASLDHLPIIMIVKVGTPARYIAIAAPERMEWVPMSLGSNPSFSSPMRCPADCSFVRTVLDVIVRSLPLIRIVLTVVLVSVPG